MPTITLSEAYDAKLKTLVTEPFEDTRESLVEGLIDEAVTRRGVSPNGTGYVPAAKDSLLRQDPDSHASLDHTRIVSATVDGRAVHARNGTV